MKFDHQKRILDIIVASILTVAFLPFWIIIPILIYLDSGVPIIFSHERLGKDGEKFMIFKFRSMVPNAHKILHEHNSELLKQFKEKDWKIEADEDPRITKLGRLLRALTIDEFPQLLNVLRGEMSMVGPRAYMEQELKEQTNRYPQTKKHLPDILSVKPGITGVWQTSGRNKIGFPQRAKMDAQYARHRSIWKDIYILLKTPKAMLSKW
ncbi:MAG: sugar transferase [Candidatus Pacebacteria bacterium]|nr:sugar transferase [Candidatus Paceibacterota bacterium]